MKLSLIILLITVATNLFASNLQIETKTYYEQKEAYIINIEYPYVSDVTKLVEEINLKIKSMVDLRVKNFEALVLKNKPASLSTLDGRVSIDLNNSSIFSGEIHY